MGVYYTATALIGYKIGLAAFFEKQKVQSCSCAKFHEYMVSGKFCPECGEKLAITEQTVTDDRLMDLQEKLYENCPDGITFALDLEYTKTLYIGVGVSAERGEAEFCSLPDKESVDALVKETLEDFEDYVTLGKFGLYAIHFGS